MFFQVIEEHLLHNGTRLDFLIPHIATAFEYDGRQHSVYTPFFHGDEAGFRAAKRRDAEKDFICETEGIRLIRIQDDGSLSEALIRQLLRETPYPKNDVVFELEPTKKETRLEEASKRRSEYRKKNKRVEDPDVREARLGKQRAYRKKRREERKEWLSKQSASE